VVKIFFWIYSGWVKTYQILCSSSALKVVTSCPFITFLPIYQTTLLRNTEDQIVGTERRLSLSVCEDSCFLDYDAVWIIRVD
jgi:hypothetical protein